MKKIVLLAGSLFVLSCSQFSEPQGLSNDRGLNQQTMADVSLEATFTSIKENIIDKKCLSCHNVGSKSDANSMPFETEAQVVSGSSDLGALVVPGRPAESLLYRSIVNSEAIRGRAKIMPPQDSQHSAVTAAEQHVVAAWIAGVVVKSNEPPQPLPAPSVSEPPVAAQPPSSVPPIPAEPVPSAALPDVVDFSFLKSEVLEKKCMVCHKVGGKADELIFSTRDELIALSNSFGQAFVVIGDPGQSIMYLSVVKDEDIRQDIRLMPPKKDIVAGKVSDVTAKDVALIHKWISDGAK